MRVSLVVEGAYPYVRGGVSSWIQQLMLHMPDVEFVVQSIVASPEESRSFKYRIPDNCSEIQEIYLIGDDHVAPGHRRMRMSDEQYDAFEALMFGNDPDWDTIFRFFSENEVSLNELLSGEDFLSMTLNYYEQHHSRIVFTDFLWTMRSMYLPLFTILKGRTERFDLYHSASAGYAGIWAALQHVLYGSPFLMSEHGIYTREREEEIIKADWVKGVYKDLWIGQFNKIGKCCYDYANKVVALYEDARQFELSLGCKTEKTLVIPNGMNPAQFASCPCKDPDDPYINLGALLRVAPIKDVKTMINAFALAKQSEPRLKLWIMGDLEEAPEYAAECRELVEALGVRDVMFTGVVYAADYIGKMDIMLLSSLSEGQPFTILEAFTAKRPFIATNVGNCRGLLEGEFDDFGAAGAVVPIMNERLMAREILRLARNPELRARMGETGFKRVCAHYDENDCYGRYHDLYFELAGAR